MWQWLACDDKKACRGFTTARWKDLGTYHVVPPNNTMDDAGTKKNISAWT